MDDRIEELNRAVEQRAAAEQRGDAPFLEDALTGDFVGLGPLGFMLTKDQWVASFGAGRLRHQPFGVDEVAPRFYGEAAVVTCRQIQAGEFRATPVLAERGGRWLLGRLAREPHRWNAVVP